MNLRRIRHGLVAAVACTGIVSFPSAAQQPSPGASGPSRLLNRVTDAYPSWSPDGEWIAYMSTADGDFDVYAVAPRLGERRQLTDAPGRDGTPVWSPDGTRVAFQSFRDGPSQIYVMNADGTAQRNLSNGPWHDEHPFWSADGEELLFASNRDAEAATPDNVDIYVMNADGSDVRRITHTPEVETYPSWSPDGTRIAVRRVMADGNWEVIVLDADGTNPMVIAPHPAADGWPAWSPDGRRLVFSSERSGSADLWLADLETGALQRLTWDNRADERQPWFSPDGRQVVYARYEWFPGEPFYEASQIHVIPVIGSERPGTPAAPAARAHHRLLSLPTGGVRLIGGSTHTGAGYVWFDDVWTRRPGGHWRADPPLPFRRSSHALAHDRERNGAFLFGGIDSSGSSRADGTVWIGADGRWEARARVAGEGWAEPGACFDRRRGRVVVYGGWNRTGGLRGDTWEWDGRQILLVAAADSSPPARAGHELAWDPIGERCLMFGGRTAEGLQNDTWGWDGRTWRRLDVAGPPPRWFFGMTTVEPWGAVILFGGAAEENDLADTWRWDGSRWTRLTAAGPPARGMSRVAFDGEQVVLFGGRSRRVDPQQGQGRFVDLADTWLFDGRRWQEAGR